MVLEPYYVLLMLLYFILTKTPFHKWDLTDGSPEAQSPVVTWHNVISAAAIPTQNSNLAPRTVYFITSELRSLFSNGCISPYFSMAYGTFKKTITLIQIRFYLIMLLMFSAFISSMTLGLSCSLCEFGDYGQIA